MRIGVLADTHIPDRLGALPPAVDKAFRDVDIILHAGDISQLQVLRSLQDRYTLTFGVYGDADSEEVQRYLLRRQVLEFRTRRFGLIHSPHPQRIDWITRLRWIVRPPAPTEMLDYLSAEFAEDSVHCIVFGHTHKPYLKYHKGILFFNPGSVVPARRQPPTVGVLNVTDRSVTADVITL